jgi:hypothetical protein
MAWARHGHGMASVNQTRPHCKKQIGTTQSKPLAPWHGRGTAWARHGQVMLCVNRPLRFHVLYLFNVIYDRSVLEPITKRSHTEANASCKVVGTPRKILFIFLNFTFKGPCIMIYSYSKSQKVAPFLNFIW